MKRIALGALLVLFTIGLALPLLAQNAPDPRLDRKTTCTTGYARLHDIVDELRTGSGVKIECGENLKDWKIRDIPVFVYVKDMPLGKLLRSIADATHTQLVRINSADNKPPTYRLYRTSDAKKLMSDVIEDRAKLGMECAHWAWDAMVALGKNPNVKLPARSKDNDQDPEITRVLARIMANLSDQEKETVFSKGQIKLRANEHPQAALIKDLYRLACDEQSRKSSGDRQPANPDEAYLILEVYQSRFSDCYTGFVAFMGGLPAAQTASGMSFSSPWLGEVMRPAIALQDVKELKLPPRPKYDPSERLEDPIPNPSLKKLSTDEDWKAALVQSKAKISVPENKDDWRCADVLSAIAESAHINIVCEDFFSHKMPEASGLKFGLPAEGVVAADLRALGGFKWFVDEQNRLLVGWDQLWRARHSALVTEAFLAGFKEKLNTTGVDFEDFVTLVRLNGAQHDAWIVGTRDLQGLNWRAESEDGGLWKLYDMLTPEQKQLARTEQGMPLSMVDSKWLSAYLADALEKSQKGVVRMSADEPKDISRKRAVYNDPVSLAGAILTLRQLQPPDGSSGRGVHWSSGGAILSPDHGYRIRISGTKAGEGFSVESTMPIEFPIRPAKPSQAVVITNTALEAK